MTDRQPATQGRAHRKNVYQCKTDVVKVEKISNLPTSGNRSSACVALPGPCWHIAWPLCARKPPPRAHHPRRYSSCQFIDHLPCTAVSAIKHVVLGFSLSESIRVGMDKASKRTQGSRFLCLAPTRKIGGRQRVPRPAQKQPPERRKPLTRRESGRRSTPGRPRARVRLAPRCSNVEFWSGARRGRPTGPENSHQKVVGVLSIRPRLP